MKKLISANGLIPSFAVLLPLIAFFLTLTHNQASAQSWQWAKSAGGNFHDGGNSVSTDAGGNVYMTGYFNSASITFGTTILTNTNAGYDDIFIVKYDASGNALWAKSAGGTSFDYGTSVATDTNGNVMVMGYFQSPSITFGTTTLTKAGGADIFLVKYDASGNVLWAKSAGGNSFERGTSVSTDANGNVLVTGYFQSPTITFGTTTLTNAGNEDIFLVKYDAAGNVLWAKSAGGTGIDWGNNVATDANGNVIVTGYFSSPSITFGTTTLTNAGNYDIFIVKYDASGNVLWAKSAGGTGIDWGNSVSTDAGGNVYMTGSFSSPSITFGTTILTNTNAGYDDIIIVKYDASGNVLWAKSAGGIAYDYGLSVATDANGNVYVTGVFDSPSLTFGTTTLTNAGYDDILIVKYDASGNVLWAKSTGGTSWDYGSSVSTDAGGNVYITGWFESPTITFGTTTLTNGGDWDVFLAKLDGCITELNAGTDVQTACNSFTWIDGNTYTANNNTATFNIVGGAANGCDSLVTLNLTVTTIDTSVTANLPVLTSNQNSAVYQWVDCNNTFAAITGETNQSYTATANGNYAVVITLNGCTDTSACYNVTGLGVGEGVNIFKMKEDIIVYPNPFSSATTLQTNNLLHNATLTVYNSFGQVVKQMDNLSGQTIIIFRDNLPSGLYFVRLTEENLPDRQAGKTIAVENLVITDK